LASCQGTEAIALGILIFPREEPSVADKDANGQIVETPEQATQAERSPDTFYILVSP